MYAFAKSGVLSDGQIVSDINNMANTLIGFPLQIERIL